ncbi:MAG: phosphate starvation-inducible protein PhoH [Bacteroidetes bacterium]|nr:PhoH family protein [Bacteroidia bacterium]PCH68515.1 MAG: phosphate starvation-inducible protein PhoH [Bacteroidota bacterium]
MSELTINIEEINPVDLLGVNNKKLTLIKKTFPKLKIISRGTQLKAIGEQKSLDAFEEKINLIFSHVNEYGQLSASNLEAILNNKNGDAEPDDKKIGKDVIVYGANGKIINARTPGQKKMVKLSESNDIIFAIGCAGTGKTYTAVALAVRALKNKEVKKIVLTRPAVEAGESLGFLPGDLREKIDPYLQPLYDALEDMIPMQKLVSFLEQGTIEIAPLAFMRGRTLDNACVILDEAQNTSQLQLKMFLTRMGPNAKFILTGDVTQIDLPDKMKSGLQHAVKLLKGIKGIGFIHLTEQDVVRHELVKKVLRAYEK